MASGYADSGRYDPESVPQGSGDAGGPTSPYSFLSFLFEKGRIYRYLTAGMPRVKRVEFEQYYRWVIESLGNLEFGRNIESVSYDGDSLMVDLGDEQVTTRHLVLGTGLTPRVPDFALPYEGSTVVHSSRFLDQSRELAGKRIAIVGGGQSGAEIFQHLVADSANLPAEVMWITRRPNLMPLDDSPFVEEIFTPSYSDYFFALPSEQKERLLAFHRMASDGISANLLMSIYNRLYDLEFNEGCDRLWRLYPESEVEAMEPGPAGWRLQLTERQPDCQRLLDVDLVLLATGFEHKIPAFLDPLRSRLEFDGDHFKVRGDFSIAWDGAARNKIFVQNAARHSRGLPDPNLSLMAWRSAKIVNSLAGRQVYDVSEQSSVFDWQSSLVRQPMSMAGQDP
nr:L-lysine N6-monooxygenase-like [Nerophis lumbriciformis]